MRRHRIHLPGLETGTRVVTGGEASHLGLVLRVAPGTAVRAFDGSGLEADGVVVEASPGRVVLEFGEVQPSGTEAALPVTVAVALLKGDKLADVIRAGTELGAVRFRLLLCRHNDVPALSPNKLERLRRVAREAAKQSGRAVVPEVDDAVRLDALSWDGSALVAHPRARGTLDEAQPTTAPGLTIITGPEGGLTDDEVAQLERRGALAVRLGARILRAETAPIALLAALLLPEAL